MDEKAHKCMALSRVSGGAWTPKRQQDMDGVGKMADAYNVADQEVNATG